MGSLMHLFFDAYCATFNWDVFSSSSSLLCK